MSSLLSSTHHKSPQQPQHEYVLEYEVGDGNKYLIGTFVWSGDKVAIAQAKRMIVLEKEITKIYVWRGPTLIEAIEQYDSGYSYHSNKRGTLSEWNRIRGVNAEAETLDDARKYASLLAVEFNHGQVKVERLGQVVTICSGPESYEDNEYLKFLDKHVADRAKIREQREQKKKDDLRSLADSVLEEMKLPDEQTIQETVQEQARTQGDAQSPAPGV